MPRALRSTGHRHDQASQPVARRRDCTHSALSTGPSPNAAIAGYSRPTPAKRLAAVEPTGRLPRSTNGASPTAVPAPSTFPAPLVLSGDDLALDPTYPPQSLLSWLRCKDRNPVTSDRRTIYVAGPPDVDDGVAFVTDWASPCIRRRSTTESASKPPDVTALLNYLTAFYHGLPVKLLPTPLTFTSWTKRPRRPAKSAAAAEAPSHIGLRVGDSPSIVGVATRPCPDTAFPRQLDLNHLLDAIADDSVLPADAYAVLLLVHHDLFEDPDDDFCCGRAFGGSRIAVVSTARYNPALDVAAGLDLEHAWPASHCATYIDRVLSSAPARAKVPRPTSSDSPDLATPGSALTAAAAAAGADAALQSPATLWLSRAARTASHELGHCFAMDHCVYYACSMQGTASIAEDLRQPPYLCPVCLAKLVYAVGGGSPGTVRRSRSSSSSSSTTAVAASLDGHSGYARERYAALRSACKLLAGDQGGGGMFAAFAAWIDVRMRESAV
ncbi:Archaemetzincin-1 [Cladochytrium tenue]|nr:Archaemetzincin-1 [Cladochytrium tenue]